MNHKCRTPPFFCGLVTALSPFPSLRFPLPPQKEETVFHPNPIPQDFVRSEQVVVVGYYHNDSFVADKVLLKCPSKYQEEEINI